MKKGAILFVLDRNYLVGLQVFLFSVRFALMNRTEDIVILTNDIGVKNNLFVQNIADKVIFLDDEEINKLSKVKSDKVKSSLKVDKIGKYTFLKFFLFKPLGYDYHIYFDVDMICLDKDFRFNELISDYDISVTSTIGYGFLGTKDLSVISEDKKYAIYQKIKKAANYKYSISRGFNSGVLFINKKLISDQTVSGLINLVSSYSFNLEQKATASYLKKQNIHVNYLPMWYNFVSLPCYTIGEEYFNKLKPRLKFLHYNRKKPWSFERNWLNDLWIEKFNESGGWVNFIERGGK